MVFSKYAGKAKKVGFDVFDKFLQGVADKKGCSKEEVSEDPTYQSSCAKMLSASPPLR